MALLTCSSEITAPAGMMVVKVKELNNELPVRARAAWGGGLRGGGDGDAGRGDDGGGGGESIMPLMLAMPH